MPAISRWFTVLSSNYASHDPDNTKTFPHKPLVQYLVVKPACSVVVLDSSLNKLCAYHICGKMTKITTIIDRSTICSNEIKLEKFEM